MPSTTTARAIVRTIVARRPLIASVVVLGWSTKYLVSLGLTHTTGPEIYGVLTAAISTGAAISNIAVLGAPRRRLVVPAMVLVAWALVAIAGLGGTIAHVVGPVAGHGPIDLRPRPIPAPLVFTVLGVVGGVALFFGQRTANRRATTIETESI
jgi:hypothetical protein